MVAYSLKRSRFQKENEKKKYNVPLLGKSYPNPSQKVSYKWYFSCSGSARNHHPPMKGYYIKWNPLFCLRFSFLRCPSSDQTLFPDLETSHLSFTPYRLLFLIFLFLLLGVWGWLSLLVLSEGTTWSQGITEHSVGLLWGEYRLKEACWKQLRNRFLSAICVA